MPSICHLSSVHPLTDTRIRKECSSIEELGNDISLIIQAKNDFTEKGLKIYGIPSFRNRLIRVIVGSFLLLRRAIKVDKEFYHFHDPELIPAGIILKILGKKVIYDIHEDLPRQILDKHWVPKSLRLPLSSIIERFENISVKSFDKLVCATPHIAKRFSVIHKNVVTINNYPSLKEISLHSRTRNSYDALPIRLVYIGAITEHRGIINILDSIKEINCVLELGGSFESEELHKLCLSHESWSKVNYHGYVGRKEFYKILEKSHIGLVIFHPISNHIDAMPNKLFEFMSAGLPVICSDFPLWKDLVESNNVGTCVNPKENSEIESSITMYSVSQDLIQQHGREGSRLVQDEFNWESQINKLSGLYNSES